LEKKLIYIVKNRLLFSPDAIPVLKTLNIKLKKHQNSTEIMNALDETKPSNTNEQMQTAYAIAMGEIRKMPQEMAKCIINIFKEFADEAHKINTTLESFLQHGTT
jgi:putative heme iron utilization protein